MTDRRSHIDSRAILLLVGCCFLWGLQQVVAKTTLPLMAPVLQAAMRSALAALLVWAWAWRKGTALFVRDDTWPGGLLAGTIFALEFICLYLALEFTTVSRLVVLLYLAPFVVAVGMPFIARSERLSPVQAGGLVLGFGALVLAFGDSLFGGDRVPRQWIGDLLALVGALLWGATTLLIRASRLSTAAPERTLFYQLAVSAPLLFVASALHGEAWPVVWSWRLWGSMFYQSVVVACASYLVWFWMIRHYPATRLASFTFLTPLFGLGLGWALLGEAISSQLVAALVGVAAGIWLVNRQRA